MSHTLGFTSLTEEVSDVRLELRGSLPDWLRGKLVRTGPALYEAGSEQFRHWFDGLSMLYRFSFDDGAISYSNRFLQSKAYSDARTKGRITHREFGTDPYRSYLRRIASPPTDNANVNILWFDGTHVATTETVKMQEIRADELATVGRFRLDGAPFGVTQPAHLHYDPDTGEWISYVTSPIRSGYRVYRVRPGTKRAELIASVPAKEPAYIHSFALTPSFVVLVEYPLVMRPIDLGLSGKPFIENFKWKPDRATRFLVIDRSDGRVSRVHETDPFFCFHHVNAFETPEELTVDLTFYPDAGVIRDLYLDRLRDETSSLQLGEVRRYHLSRDGAAISYDVLCEERADFPRINLWLNTHDYRYMYAAGTRSNPSDDFVNQLFKLDLRSRSVQTWFEDGCYPGEPVFVSASREGAEDEGVILCVVFNTARGNSFLLVLDASSFSELARAELPHRVPFGLHGQFFDAAGADRNLTPFGVSH
ncbi:MAG: carotenoid oxygenase family protein [Gaiellaceae bacterium]